MFVDKKALIAVVSYALVAQAQSSDNASTTTSAPASQTSLPAGLDTCIIGCVTYAATVSNCSSYTNVTCVCTSTTFQSAAGQCLSQNCTAADIAAAEQLQNSECGALSTTSTAPSTTATSTSSSATTSGTTTPTSTSGAMTLTAPFSFGTLIGTLVASAGALVGAAFVF